MQFIPVMILALLHQCSRNNSDYYQFWKLLCCFMFIFL